MVGNDSLLETLFVFAGVYMRVIIYSYGYSCIGDRERKHTIVHVMV